MEWWEKLVWNINLLGLSLVFSMMLIQHATFFYSFPPNLSLIVYVNPMVYLIMTFAVYTMFKVSHYASEAAGVLPDPGDDDEEQS
jgi:hypothetical protein